MISKNMSSGKEQQSKNLKTVTEGADIGTHYAPVEKKVRKSTFSQARTCCKKGISERNSAKKTLMIKHIHIKINVEFQKNAERGPA